MAGAGGPGKLEQLIRQMLEKALREEDKKEKAHHDRNQ